MTRQEYEQKYGQPPALRTQTPSQPTEEPGLIQGIVRGAASPFLRLGANIAKMGKQVSKGTPLTQEELNAPVSYGSYLGSYRPVGQSGNFGKDVKDAVGTGLEVASYAVPGGEVGALGKAGLKGALLQGAKSGAIIGGEAGLLGGTGRGLQEDNSLLDVAKQGVLEGAGGAVGGAALGLAGAGISRGIGAVKEGIQTAMHPQEAAINKIANAYKDVAGQTSKANRVLTQSLSRGKDPAKFLASRNIVPEVEGGTIKTEAAQMKLLDQVAPLNAHLEEALKAVQPGVPRVSVTGLRATAIRRANEMPNITESAREQIKKAINKEFSLLEKKHGATGDLLTINAIKKAAWGETKFDALHPYQTDANYLIGSAAKKAIEDAVPKDAFSVKELNAAIGDFYDAKDFLAAIENKKVKGGRLGGYFGRTIGAIAGAKYGPLGSITGAMGGDAVSNILQSRTFTTPLKQLILKNLELKDPAAYQKALEFIKKAGLEQEMRLRLPAPSAINIPPRVPAAGESSVKALLAKPGLPNVNRETGRIQRTFTSEGL